MSPNEAEFKRRVFWTFYSVTRVFFICGSDALPLKDEDIAVRLPSDDIAWRYSGYTEESKFTYKDISQYYAVGKTPGVPNDNYSTVIRAFGLSARVNVFTSSRWLKNHKPQNQINLKFIRLTKELDDFKKHLESRYPESLYSVKDNSKMVQKANVPSGNLDYLTFGLLSYHNYYGMLIRLYQSELVRDPSCHIHPNRIKNAKIESIKYTIKNCEFYNWSDNYSQLERFVSDFTPRKVPTLLVLLNCALVDYFIDDKNISTIYKIMTSRFKNIGNRLDNVVYLDSLFKNLYLIKKLSHYNNSTEHDLISEMEKFAISEKDINPWIVPKYSTFFKFSCCFKSNYSTINIKDYLKPFENDGTKNVIY
ncbi:hypothetical protein AYI70_g10721 [Smittium culicis]|uniref:Transcription factor domain-containing protein n=1 Tax=Smittium culicis TaxID=133412 RepID=A0A1R1X5A8_9FUNG|nr:hypothetical protein AYI70_g10721 [Smittium culicis]